jgi:hypothetical protein
MFDVKWTCKLVCTIFVSVHVTYLLSYFSDRTQPARQVTLLGHAIVKYTPQKEQNNENVFFANENNENVNAI